MKKALALLAYSRASYFQLVLPSILAQKVSGRPLTDVYDIYIFQDGLWDGEEETARSEYARLARALQPVPTDIAVYRQERNLGVALHFDFVERLLFVDKQYDYVIFCEDDLILAPGYVETLDLMVEKFHADPRIGMVSANPGVTTESGDQQRRNRHRFRSMDHNWGFGLFRSFWARRQPLVDEYLSLISDVPYRKRPTPAVLSWLDVAGFHGRASSQDYVKQCATAALGAIRVSTHPNFGLPIGRTGLHCTPKLFQEMGFDRTVVFDEGIASIGDLDEEQFRSIYQAQSSRLLKDAERFDAETWAERLCTGAFSSARFRPAADALAKVTSAQVVEAYRVLLNREPENDQVVAAKTGLSHLHLLESILASDEFLNRSSLAPMLKTVANKMESLTREGEQRAAGE